MQPQPI